MQSSVQNSSAPMDAKALKGKRGIRRLINAFGYSFKGFKAAFANEDAFRQECLLLVIMLPVALFLPVSTTQKALLCLSLFIVILVELINSAIEAVVDRVGLEIHPLSGMAKDLGSAAVLTSLVISALIWILVLADLLQN